MTTGFDIFAAAFATNVPPGGVAATASHDGATSRAALSPDIATTDRTTEDGIAAARAEGFKIVPLCSYVEAQFRRHPEWEDLRER